MVLAFLADPHRNDPACARAYHSMLEFLRFLRCAGNGLSKCQWVAANDPPSQSLVQRIQLDFEFFGFRLSKDLTLGVSLGFDIQGSQTTAPAARSAPMLCRSGQSASLKTFASRKASLIFDLTCGLRKLSKLLQNDGVYVESHVQSQLVGCTLTRDRLFAAALDSSNDCRFYGSTKETLSHLVHECVSYSTDHPRPNAHEFGANFGCLGIVEPQ